VGLVGFRKSFMGYNCNDVARYFESSEAKHVSREKELLEKVDSQIEINSQINTDLKDCIKQLNDVININQTLSDELEDYKTKQAEIQRLSESIGKLYLVAQANAQTIIDNSKANRNASCEEVAKNIEGIENVQSHLEILKDRLSETTTKFSEELEEINDSLNQTKQIIDDRAEKIECAEKTMDKLIGSVNVEVNA